MGNTRTVQATGPDGTVANRTSKSKVYTHALAIHFPPQDGYTVPAGTYTVPKKRIRGRNIPAYQTTVSQDVVVPGQDESFGVISFHTSWDAANKAGQTYINTAAASAADERATFGVDARSIATGWRVVEVEVLDEGFNA